MVGLGVDFLVVEFFGEFFVIVFDSNENFLFGYGDLIVVVY